MSGGASSILRNKKLWAVVGVGECVATLYAWDRYQLSNVHKELMAQARSFGEAPLRDDERPGKLTVIATAPNKSELSKIKENWKAYSVGLLTAAGVDYRLLEVNYEELNSKFDTELPVPDGVAVDLESKSAPSQVFNDANWMRPSLSSTAALDQDTESFIAKFFDGDMPKYSFWRKNAAKLYDANSPALASLRAETSKIIERELENKSSHGDPLPMKAFLISCGDGDQAWYKSIYMFFRKAAVAKEIGSSTIAVIKATNK